MLDTLLPILFVVDVVTDRELVDQALNDGYQVVEIEVARRPGDLLSAEGEIGGAYLRSCTGEVFEVVLEPLDVDLARNPLGLVFENDVKICDLMLRWDGDLVITGQGPNVRFTLQARPRRSVFRLSSGRAASVISRYRVIDGRLPQGGDPRVRARWLGPDLE